ncbi:MAG: hypothetical protein NWT08_06530 [Akkermansiaceae bacterium]|nr:hypothetical protein [Akkermansiaceae bacterium]MDP4647773.1 hypothetical protein [Akkermansiaceae bacterium]MDP4780848.1 hypothetical protein [Akkermansiaceae bacterium]MDP4848422.1 hypothetical protein [Akkermansiaceae bacterium]
MSKRGSFDLRNRICKIPRQKRLRLVDHRAEESKGAFVSTCFFSCGVSNFVFPLKRIVEGFEPLKEWRVGVVQDDAKGMGGGVGEVVAAEFLEGGG